MYLLSGHGKRICTLEEYIPLWVWIRIMEMCSYYNSLIAQVALRTKYEEPYAGNWTVMEASLLRRYGRNCQPLVPLCLLVELCSYLEHIQDDLPSQPWAVLNLLYSSSAKFWGFYKVIVLFGIWSLKRSVLAVFIWLFMVCFSGIICPY